MVPSNETEIKILFSFSIKRILIMTNIAGFIRDIVQTVYQCQTKRSTILFIRPNGLAVRSNNLFICSNRLFIHSKNISIRSFSHSNSFPLVSVCLLGSKGGAVVRALPSQQCGPGTNPGANALCGLSLLLVLSLVRRGFSLGTPVFPSP